MTDTQEAIDILLQTAREYGEHEPRATDGDVVAAAYRLAAAKLREHGSSHTKILEIAAAQVQGRAVL